MPRRKTISLTLLLGPTRKQKDPLLFGVFGFRASGFRVPGLNELGLR